MWIPTKLFHMSNRDTQRCHKLFKVQLLDFEGLEMLYIVFAELCYLITLGVNILSIENVI